VDGSPGGHHASPGPERRDDETFLLDLAGAVDDDFCHLTTRGRVTGAPHEIEIWFALDGRTLYLHSGGGVRSDWVRNLVADPEVTVRLRGTVYTGVARVIEAGTHDDARARASVYDKYAPRYSGNLDSWRATGLPVAVELRSQASSERP
jgi:deazaflavin-dependent oxidoreductase (nitroreductase family)